MADPWFMCELALEMGMTLRDLGDRASNFEVCVTWPAFFAERARVAKVEEARQEQAQEIQRSRI